jgi:hypothetical protein
MKWCLCLCNRYGNNVNKISNIITPGLNIIGNLSAVPNVSRRAIFQFNFSLVNVAGSNRYVYSITISSYVTAFNVGFGNV